MCTVSFLPQQAGSFILTASRDEAFERPAAKFPFSKETPIHNKFIYPLDPQGNGSWIATSLKASVCLLNGGLVEHKHDPPYKHSRGKVVTDFFEFARIEKFIDDYSFEGLEPFTLLMIEHRDSINFHKLVWDGSKKYLSEVDAGKPGIWSSVTLYSAEIIALREAWFSEWLDQTDEYNLEKIRNFHHFGGSGDIENTIKMQRGQKLGSLSITSIESVEGLHQMVYEDLTTSRIQHCSLDDRHNPQTRKNENA